MSEKMIFREADAADIPAIRVIRSAVKENTLSDPERIPAALIGQYLSTLGKGWVCELDGKIVGFSFAANQDDSIWALFVLPEFEGRGVGKALLARATGWLFDQGAESVTLGTAPDTRADRFYRAQGWTRGELRANGEVSYRLERRITR